MRFRVALFLLFQIQFATADSIPESDRKDAILESSPDAILVHGMSRHNGMLTNQPQHETNWGLGYSKTLNSNHSLAGGFYRNSENRQSRYLLHDHKLYESGNWQFGFLSGVVTGYSQRKYLPLLVPKLCWKARAVAPSGALCGISNYHGDIGLFLQLDIK